MRKRRQHALAAAVVAVAAAAAASAPAASARPFWEDPSFEADLGLTAFKAPAAAPSSPGPYRPSGEMRFREQRGDAEGDASSPSTSLRALRHRLRAGGLPPRSLADRLGRREGGDDEPMFSDVPKGLEPPMSYGDTGAFYRFQQQTEGADAYRREAADEGPFGGQSQHAPVAPQTTNTGRFEAPEFTEVMSQLKEIVRDPRGEKAKAAASTKHMLSSVVSAPGRAPPMAPAPPGGLASGPPIPMPSPILTPIDRKPDQPAEAAAKRADAGAANSAAHAPQRKPHFLLETAADAHLAAPPSPAAESLVETRAKVEDPSEMLRHLATGRADDAPAKLPIMQVHEMDERLANNPYVRFD